ncbi:1-phosphofructokinase [Alkalicoccus daliensis]|uniref:Tagatose-6-phosphate kinase n=1 Tax=Alkalicoccus daliensis TaxID=745820 RepID=A0A1H0IPY7_9BACI|nr:1-phosphofructokinase [Alkalicoccus daliensis]SDO33507.1 1-phosphofructokinase [Alkalicoccus daliensis]
MIYTMTLNPSVDYLVSVNNFQLGKTNRADTQRMVPGGKGINVSKVLQLFHIPTKLFGFTAGFTGEFIQNTLQKQGLDTSFIEVEGMTRINVKLKTDAETEVNGQSPEITEQDAAKLIKQLDQLQEEDTLVLSGSLPTNLSPDFYASLMEAAAVKNIRTVLDTSGEPLRSGLKANPFLIKPNIAELEALYDTKTETQEEVITLAKRAVEDGAQHVLVSSGGSPALLVSKEQVLEASVPKGEVKNSVGAGDSMVAGFLFSLTEKDDLVQALKTSVAFGSATAFSQGFVTEETFQRLLPDIQVKTFQIGGK